MVNFNNNNIVLMILIVLIALIPIMVVFNKITSDLYPLAIIVIAISLLFHRSLISMYMTGWDIHVEYYFHKLVVDNAYWNSNIESNVNAMLSIVIMPTIYSYFLKLDGAWVFKIVYPIIFSLVPLGLYYVYRHQIKSDKIAFFSVFFFMSFYPFFTEMPSLNRQEIAELFFVLLLFLMVQETISKNIRNILLLVFGASLVTSHYGLSYIYIILIMFIYLFSIDTIRTSITKIWTQPEFNLKKLTLKYFVAFFIIFALLWYIYVSSSSVFKSIVNVGDHVITGIFTEFFNLENRDSNLLMALGIKDPVVPSFGREIYRYLQFSTQFFIIIGFFKIIINKDFIKLKAEYFYLIAASLAILLLSVLPYSAQTLNMTRIYHIALIALSPLFIIGGIFIIKKSMAVIKIKNKLIQNYALSILILSVLVPYFLFNTGFIYEMTNDVPSSMSLGMERMKNDNFTKVQFYNTYTPDQDVYGAIWFHNNRNVNKTIYGDRDSGLNVLSSYGMIPRSTLLAPFKGTELYTPSYRGGYYLYLRKLNVCDDVFVVSSMFKFNMTVFSPLFNKTSNIYSNGCGDIYKK